MGKSVFDDAFCSLGLEKGCEQEGGKAVCNR